MLFVLMFVRIATAASAEEPPPDPERRAVVHFESTKEGLIIGTIVGRATAGSVTAVSSKDLCTAPCKVDVPFGFQEFYGHGGGHVATMKKLEIRDEEVTIRVAPVSSALRTTGILAGRLGILGTIGLTTGALLAPINDKPAGPWIAGAVASGALAVGGFTLTSVHRAKWTVVAEP